MAWKHKEKKAFLMDNNEKHNQLSDLKLFNKKSKPLKQIWNEMKKNTAWCGRSQLMGRIYCVSIWNGRGILIIFPYLAHQKTSTKNIASML